MENYLKDGKYFFIDGFNLFWSVNVENNKVITNFNENYQIIKNTYSKSGLSICWLDGNFGDNSGGFVIDEFTLFNAASIPDSVFE